MMMIGKSTPGSQDRLGGTVAIAALGDDAIELGQARQYAGNGALRDVLRPVAMDRAHDRELGVLRDTCLDAGMDLVIDENTCKPANFQQIAPVGQSLGKVLHLVAAHLLEIDRDAPCAWFGDDAVERHDDDARVAGLLTAPFRAVGEAALTTIAS